MYLRNSDEGKVNEQIIILYELQLKGNITKSKPILAEPAIATIPRHKNRTYVKKSNNAIQEAYDKNGWK